MSAQRAGGGGPHTQAGSTTRAPCSTTVARWSILRTRRPEDGRTPTCTVFENDLISSFTVSEPLAIILFLQISFWSRNILSVGVGATFMACTS